MNIKRLYGSLVQFNVLKLFHKILSRPFELFQERPQDMQYFTCVFSLKEPINSANLKIAHEYVEVAFAWLQS